MMGYEFVNERGMSIFVKADTATEAKEEKDRLQKKIGLPGKYRCIGYKVVDELVDMPEQAELF